jgi:hypothetical protein
VQRRLWPALRRKVGPPRIVQDLSPLLDALSELGRARLLLLTGHRPFGFALGAIPVQLDLLAPNCLLEMDSARPAAMKAVAWPPNGNRLIGHGEKPSQRSVSRREVPQASVDMASIALGGFHARGS